MHVFHEKEGLFKGQEHKGFLDRRGRGKSLKYNDSIGTNSQTLKQGTQSWKNAFFKKP